MTRASSTLPIPNRKYIAAESPLPRKFPYPVDVTDNERALGRASVFRAVSLRRAERGEGEGSFVRVVGCCSIVRDFPYAANSSG